MVQTTVLVSLLVSSLLYSQTEAATLNGLLKAPGFLAKGGSRRDTGWGGREVEVEPRGRTGTSDGCPIGWAECSAFTCYPLDGSRCCSDGTFCERGYYCDFGGCCPEGELCSGRAPPPSTIHFTTTSTRRVTSATTIRTTSSISESLPTTMSSISTFVGYSPPDQSTDLGSMTGPLAGTTSGEGLSSTSRPAAGSNPTGFVGSGSGATPTVSRDVHTGMWVAALLAAVMYLA